MAGGLSLKLGVKTGADLLLGINQIILSGSIASVDFELLSIVLFALAIESDLNLTESLKLNFLSASTKDLDEDSISFWCGMESFTAFGNVSIPLVLTLPPFGLV